MDIEVKIIKGIPENQIKHFEDKTVYNCALLTREITKSSNAYPYLTGKLSRNEIALPIEGNNASYSLGTGVDYAKRVYSYKNVNWTNPSTKPQWYHSIFEKNAGTIVGDAVSHALREV